MSVLREREYAVKKVLWITLILNIVVALIKIFAGHYYKYLSLSSSGIESLFDGSSNVLALIAITLASRPSNKKHNYGHHKNETLGSLLISFMLFVSAIQLGFEYKELIFQKSFVTGKFGVVPLISIIISIIMSYGVSKYERKEGKRLNSSLLIADSDHTYGDMVLSFGVLFSIVCSGLGYIWPDIIIGILIIFYLIYLALKIVRNNIGELLDAAPAIKKSSIEEILKLDNVVNVHRFRARGNSNWMQIDFHLLLNPALSLVDAHNVSHHAENVLKQSLSDFCQNIDILIHIEPYEEGHVD